MVSVTHDLNDEDEKVACPLDFDYLSKEYAETLYDVVDEHRGCPVMHGSKYGGYSVVTGYDDVVAAANDAEHFSSAEGTTIPVMAGKYSIPIAMDPPEHGKYRRIIQPSFTAGAVKRIEPTIREVIVDHIESVRPDGRADLVATLAAPVPSTVIGILLGIPQESWADIRNKSQHFLDSMYAEDFPAMRAASEELERFIATQIELKRGSTADDVLSVLVNATVDDRPLNPVQLVGMTRLLLAAGHETTVFGIGNVFKHLLDRPDLLDRALADEKFLQQVIEESLRLEPPVFGVARNVKAPIETAGHAFGVGDWVLLGLGSANRDPAQFENPGEFDAERGNLSRQVAFGYGRHRCIGDGLARAEMRIAVQEVFTRLEGLRWADDARFETVVGITRGPRWIDVVW